MLSADILKKIRHIEIHTRRMLSGSLVGDSRSAVKGSGFEFDQIRDYQLGDDIRFIDWRSTARMQKLLVRQYIEERNRTVIIAVDISGSDIFGSSGDLRRETVAYLASVLSLVADYGKDHTGLLLFAQDVELFIPPSRGRMHVHTIMEKLFQFQARSRGTNIGAALDKLGQLPIKEAIVFIVSDFIDERSFEKSLRMVGQKYDVVAVRCLDRFERETPSIGFVPVIDSETGAEYTLDMRGKASRQLASFLSVRYVTQLSQFKRAGVDVLDVELGRPFIGDMVRFFRRRMTY